MKRAQPEAALHAQVAAYLRVALDPSVAWTTFPAGGGGKSRGAKLRAAGLRPGWPDIQLIWWYRRAPQFMGIELKSANGRLSPEQIACHRLIEGCGGVVLVARSLDSVIGIIEGAGIPLRARVTA